MLLLSRIGWIADRSDYNGQVDDEDDDGGEAKEVILINYLLVVI